MNESSLAYLFSLIGPLSIVPLSTETVSRYWPSSTDWSDLQSAFSHRRAAERYPAPGRAKTRHSESLTSAPRSPKSVGQLPLLEIPFYGNPVVK